MRLRTATLGVVLLLAAGGTSAAPPSSPTPSSPPSPSPAGSPNRTAPATDREVTGQAPENVRAELEAICRRFREGDNAYFGTMQVERLEARLEALAAAPTPAAGLTRVRLAAALAAERLRLGRLDEAAEGFARARALAAGLEPPAPPELVRQLVHGEALADLVAGERANCVEAHAAESCILPLLPGGRHRRPERARRAGDLYAGLLAEDADDVLARWLLSVARTITGDFPAGVPAPLRPPAGLFLPPASDAPPGPIRRWPNRAPALGVDAFDLSGGAVMDDFDGDGLLDLVASTWDPCGSLVAYRNDGRGGFEEVTAAWGLDVQLGGLNLVQGDYDGDGRLDLLVLRGAWLGGEGRIRNSLLRNDLDRPSGRFTDVTVAAGLAWPAYPTQAADWADYDGDGDLDLYVGNESRTGNPSLAGFEAAARPFPSQLFRNDGDGTFTDVARAAGVVNLAYAKGVDWGDYDDDGDPDLFVSNIGPNRLYRNEGDGTFTDVAVAAGVAAAPEVSFATWFFDFDEDGDQDLFVADYGTPFEEVVASLVAPAGAALPVSGHPVLYRNDGDGTFTDVSRAAGLDRPMLPMGANYGDLDNDGRLDVYLGTGVPDFRALMPNVMLRNVGNGRFEDVTRDGGFGHLQKGHGVAFGDLDGDGDQDLFEQMGGAYPYDAYANALYENPLEESAAPPAWITLRFAGGGANPFAVGARVTIVVRRPDGSLRRIVREVDSGGSFGASSLQQEIGLGGPAVFAALEAIEVRWPASGTIQTFRGVEANRIYRVREGAEALEPLPAPAIELGAGTPARPVHGHRDG